MIPQALPMNPQRPMQPGPMQPGPMPMLQTALPVAQPPQQGPQQMPQGQPQQMPQGPPQQRPPRKKPPTIPPPGVNPPGFKASPEQNRLFNIYEVAAHRIMHGPKSENFIRKSLESFPDPQAAVATTSARVLNLAKKAVKDSTGQAVTAPMTSQVANMVVGEVNALARELGKQPLDDDQKVNVLSWVVGQNIKQGIQSKKLDPIKMGQFVQQNIKTVSKVNAPKPPPPKPRERPTPPARAL